MLIDRSAASRAAFSYQGVSYPDYEGIKREHFAREQSAMKCPEANGVDRRFIEAFHTEQYTLLPIRDQLLTLIGSLSRQAKLRDIALDVYLLPINVSLIEQFDPAMLATVRARIDRLTKTLSGYDIALNDLSGIAPLDQFADRWCACGHLLQDGRRTVAAQLSRRQPPFDSSVSAVTP